MHRITVEACLGKKLGETTEPAILCDEGGRVLGFFSPLPYAPQFEDLQLEPPLSIAETEQLRKNRSGKPLEEILGRLGF
jgi:hypothetical protein